MNKTKTISVIALCAAINIAGSFLALALRLPIYLDSVGTILASAILPMKFAPLTGIVSSIISGTLYDPYAFYFMPVQIAIGILANYVFKKIDKKTSIFKIAILTLIVSIPASIISAIVAAYVFGGVTSSGSSILVQLLDKYLHNMVASVFIIQFITDYIDKLVGIIIVKIFVERLPERYL